jgi:hypothetical protein
MLSAARLSVDLEYGQVTIAGASIHQPDKTENVPPGYWLQPELIL